MVLRLIEIHEIYIVLEFIKESNATVKQQILYKFILALEEGSSLF